jgi:hypothetical protein
MYYYKSLHQSETGYPKMDLFVSVLWGTLLATVCFIDLPEVTLKAFKEVPIVVKS